MDRLWDIYRQADAAFERALRFTYESDLHSDKYHESALVLYMAAKGWACDAATNASAANSPLIDRYQLISRICDFHINNHTNRINPTPM